MAGQELQGRREANSARELAEQVVALLNQLSDIGDTAIGLSEIITPGGTIVFKPWHGGEWALQPMR